MEKNTRIGYIDIMKGLCIIIVVMQHARLLPDADGGALIRICKSFHMPMFFFVTGLFLPMRRTLRDMLADRFNRLLVPWLVFALAGGLIIDVCIWQNYDHLMHERAIMHWFVRGPNVPLYFLRALFVSTVAAWMLARVFRTTAQKCSLLPVLCVLSWSSLRLSPQIEALSYFPRLAFDFPALREAAGMLMYMWLGHIVASTCTVRRMEVGRWQGLIVFGVATAALIMIDPPEISWHYMESEGSWLPITAAALCGIAAIWGLSCALNGFPPLKVVGACSLAILVTH